MSQRLKELQDAKNTAREYDSYSGSQLSRMRQSNPPEYFRLREGKVAVGELTPQIGVRRGLEIKHYVETPAEPLTDAELSLMLKYSKEEIAQYYVTNGDKKNPDNTHIIAKKLSDSPEAIDGFVPRSAAEQLELRNAAILHKVISGSVRFPAQEAPPPVVVDDERIEAGPLGKLVGLDPNYRVTHSQYLDLQAADTKRLASRSTQQVAQDRVVELRAEAARVEKSLATAKVQ